MQSITFDKFWPIYDCRCRGARRKKQPPGLIVILTLCLFACATTLQGADSTDGQDDLVISLDKPSPALSAAQQATKDLPHPTGRITSLVTEDQRCVLYGDLFKSGESYALLETTWQHPNSPYEDYAVRNVAFARWIHDKWKLANLFNIESTWRPKGWVWQADGGADWLPFDHPANKAFELKTLSETGIPDVLIAGEVEKYFQTWYVARFDPKEKTLVVADQAMAEPKYVGGYVRLYDKSPRLSEWEEWDFCKWNGIALVQKASWHTEVPYNHEDEYFIA